MLFVLRGFWHSPSLCARDVRSGSMCERSATLNIQISFLRFATRWKRLQFRSRRSIDVAHVIWMWTFRFRRKAFDFLRLCIVPAFNLCYFSRRRMTFQGNGFHHARLAVRIILCNSSIFTLNPLPMCERASESTFRMTQRDRKIKKFQTSRRKRWQSRATMPWRDAPGKSIDKQ